MSSVRQIEANRRNAQFSTGPITEEGKKRSRQNAVRHGLTAETVICAIEDADDYAAFQLAIASDFDAQSVVERELVLRLANLLWRCVSLQRSRRGCSISKPASFCTVLETPPRTRSVKELSRPTKRRRTRTESPANSRHPACGRLELCCQLGDRRMPGAGAILSFRT